MKTLVLGDIHGVWGPANKLITKASKRHGPFTHAFQVGDMGEGWPGEKKPWRPLFDPIHFCDGNHDNHPRLRSEGGLGNDKLIYQRRGSVLEIEGYRVLFFGGADSHDREHRTEGVDWWREETITYSEMQYVLDGLKDQSPIDVVVTHDRPQCFPCPLGNSWRAGIASRQALEALYYEVRPKFWFFGHYHEPRYGQFEDTQWICLPRIERGGYAIWHGDTVELSSNIFRRVES